MKHTNQDRRFFGAGGAARNCIQTALDDASLVRIATGYFEPSGYQCLAKTLASKEVRLLIGRGENQEARIEAVLREFTQGLSSFDSEDRTRAMQALYESLKKGRLFVSVGDEPELHGTLDPRYLYHHAKIYMADERRAVISSANLSRTGLMQSIEAGITIEAPEDVAFFVSKFDEYYQRAEPIADELLKILEAWLAHHPPFLVYARSLLAVYGLPEGEVPESLPALAGYQRPIVSRILQALQETGGAMLVASTGLGKTIMAAHVLAYLRMQGLIHSALVFAPAGLKEMWRRTMRQARTSSVEFSYHTLSADDWHKNRQVYTLEYELSEASSGTLIILDESHHLRNEESQGGGLRLRNERILEAVQRGARILLMTATPYSRHLDDLNAQLRLLPKPVSKKALAGRLFATDQWEVTKASELSELQPCVVLTAPTVVRYFSQSDEKGERYVLFSGNLRRYFPRRIHLHNIDYQSELDEIFLELVEKRLLQRKLETTEHGTDLFGDEGTTGRRDPLFEARVLHQFCSSVSQIQSLFAKLKESGGFAKLRFARQDELASYVRSRLPQIESILSKHSEDKIKKLIEILKNAVSQNEKVVIFCVYRQTARYLAEVLPEALPGLKAAATVDLDSDELGRTIRSFAPVANEALLDGEDSEQIEVLIATGALAEGYNLQDASILVNFDLPWTVLTLAQRMGRILRPWQEVREIHICNLIPSTMQDERLHLAMNWKNRLLYRNREHSSFADIPVLVDKDSGDSGVELASLAGMMQSIGDVKMDLDEAVSFIEKADELKTSSFLDDIALLSEEEISCMQGLPDGIRSSKADKKEDLFYALLTYKNHYYPALFDWKGKLRMDSERADLIMERIRSVKTEVPLDPWQLPKTEDLDRIQALAMQSWAQRRNVPLEELGLACSMLLRKA